MPAMADTKPPPRTEPDMSLLIVDDDKPFLQRLARAMESRGYAVDTADSVAEGLRKADAEPPAYAVVDLRLEDGNGLDVIELIRRRRPDSRMVVLTGYGNIATAVNAVKLGAVDYLAKPVRGSAGQARCRGSPRTPRRCRRGAFRPHPQPGREGAAAGESDVGRPGPLGAHPAHLRALRPQRLGDRPAPQHAPAHPPAHPRQAGAALTARRAARPAAVAPATAGVAFFPGLSRSPRGAASPGSRRRAETGGGRLDSSPVSCQILAP